MTRAVILMQCMLLTPMWVILMQCLLLTPVWVIFEFMAAQPLFL